MAYTIKNIDAQGGLTVSFDVDSLDQHISGLLVHDRDKLDSALREYERAYCQGLRDTAPPTVHPDVKAMIGR